MSNWWKEQGGFWNNLIGSVSDGLGDMAHLIGLSDDDIAQFQYHLSSLPVIGDLYSYVDSYKQTVDYMDNRDLGWSDIMYPSKVSPNFPASAISRSLNFVSDNIASLYDDRGSRKRR